MRHKAHSGVHSGVYEIAWHWISAMTAAERSCAKRREVLEARKTMMKPSKRCDKMKNKNIWIVGDKIQLERFILFALGYDSNCVYNLTGMKYWEGYYGQPFVVYRLYNRRNIEDRLYDIKKLGGYISQEVITQHGKPAWYIKENTPIETTDYHAIILSIFTPEEVCKNLDDEKYFLKVLRQRYSVLDLRGRSLEWYPNICSK